MKTSTAPVTELRDAAIPPHHCVERVDRDGYCVTCGEKALKGPVTEWIGVKK